jgi:aldose 1-epimerase
MTVVTLRDANSGSAARIATHAGFNCFSFEAVLPDGRTVRVLSSVAGFETGGHRPSHHGIPLLFPFPNRIAKGEFSWKGISYRLPEGTVPHDHTGNAIHGFCIDRPWRTEDVTGDSVTGVFRLSMDAPDRFPLWPADAEIRVTYQIRGACLHSEIVVRNPSDVALPWGFGTHAYFSLPLAPDSDAAQCRVFAPTSRVWNLNACLPDGSQRDAAAAARLDQDLLFGGLKVDDVYTNLQRADQQTVCRLTDPAAGIAVEQRFSNDFRELVAFTPPWSSSVCLEPYTCLTDAINLQQMGVDAGLQILPQGKEWRGWIDIEAVGLAT